jgi:hypothetical protein
VSPGVLPLIVIAAILLAITLTWPEFWVPKELPFDPDHPTRGDFLRIPDQGHPPDVD